LKNRREGRKRVKKKENDGIKGDREGVKGHYVSGSREYLGGE
jgi:hypothetical protein